MGNRTQIFHTNIFVNSMRKIINLEKTISFVPGKNTPNAISRFLQPISNYRFFFYTGNMGVSNKNLLKPWKDIIAFSIATAIFIIYFDIENDFRKIISGDILLSISGALVVLQA